MELNDRDGLCEIAMFVLAETCFVGHPPRLSRPSAGCNQVNVVRSEVRGGVGLKYSCSRSMWLLNTSGWMWWLKACLHLMSLLNAPNEVALTTSSWIHLVWAGFSPTATVIVLERSIGGSLGGGGGNKKPIENVRVGWWSPTSSEDVPG